MNCHGPNNNHLANGIRPEPVENCHQKIRRESSKQIRVRDVGIIGAEFYFPKSYVAQEDLEKFDGVSSNKYTAGLGQHEMCFCHENEDVCSLALSATVALLENYHIDPKSIGFLAVGTETPVDKSKSVKSVLMDLFATSDNTDIEGVDEKNACFGGTQAMFHAVDWIYANYETDDRLAIAVCADVAVYEPGPARCTGGAGAIAFLIAPDAPIVFEKGLRAYHSSNVYDFYKPLCGPSTEYPVVDGPNSVETYLHSLDKCYRLFCNKWTRIFGANWSCSLDNFVAVLFHSPYAKLTQKAFAWLSFLDFNNNVSKNHSEWLQLENYRKMSLSEIFQEERKKNRMDKNRFTDNAMKASAQAAESKLNPFLDFNRRIGNMYTPSLYAQLMNVFLRSKLDADMDGHRILLFSYGSGCVAALFSILFCISPQRREACDALKQSAKRAYQRLDQRVKHTPEQFTEALRKRERIVQDGETFIAGEQDLSKSLFSGAFYLYEIDSRLRRFYIRNAA